MRLGPLLATTALLTLTASGCSTAPAAGPSTTGASTTTSATPTPAAVSTATWVDFSWSAAGFAAKLPAQPQQKTERTTVGSVVITMRVAAAKKVAHQGVLVADAHLSQSLPAASAATELRSSVYSFAGTSGASIVSGVATTFRGLPAYRANLAAPNGLPFELIGILKDSTDEIMVLAPKGAMFDAVTSSLRFL